MSNILPRGLGDVKPGILDAKRTRRLTLRLGHAYEARDARELVLYEREEVRAAAVRALASELRRYSAGDSWKGRFEAACASLCEATDEMLRATVSLHDAHRRIWTMLERG